VEREQVLAQPPPWLTVAPDGDRADALAGRDPSGGGAPGLQLDLPAGAAGPWLTLPAGGRGRAVTRDRVYVVDPAHDRLWALRRRTGRLERSVPVGRRPVGIAVGG